MFNAAPNDLEVVVLTTIVTPDILGDSLFSTYAVLRGCLRRFQTQPRSIRRLTV